MKLLAAMLVISLAVMLGFYRDANGTANQRQDTILSLSLKVSSLQSRVNADEITLATLQRKVSNICFYGHVVTDVSTSSFGNTAPSVSPRYAYC